MPTPNFTYGGSPSADANSRRLAMDALIRRELKVGDPSDPTQIANALLERYRDEPRAQRIAQESQGMPFMRLPQVTAAPPPASGTSIDLDQALSDVAQDLRDVTTNNLLKEVFPELQGWADGIHVAINEAVGAARLSIDTRQRDKAFALRRQLGDYARMARLVGTLTPAVTPDYRNLAQSLDEVAAVVLVLMGETLANNGFAGGKYLLSVPASELQVRREAVVYSLRNLVGSTQEAYSSSDWPRGIDAYRQIFNWLESQGQGDLRSMLMESELARMMDDMVRRASQGIAGLRALGATAQIDLQRFQRMIAVLATNPVNPQSPPLVAYWQALQLFVDGFVPAGGLRLLRIARPAILNYGLYGTSGLTPADLRLINLTILRSQLASQLDCLAGCECNQEDIKRQIVLDKVLYDVDRAIDLYAIGEQDRGQPEIRAAAYGFLVQAALYPTNYSNFTPYPGLLNPTDPQDIDAEASAVATTLGSIHDNLLPSKWLPPGQGMTWLNNPKHLLKPEYEMVQRELCLQYRTELNWESLVNQMTNVCIDAESLFGTGGLMSGVLNRSLHHLGGVAACPLPMPVIPPTLETTMSGPIFNTGSSGAGQPTTSILSDLDKIAQELKNI